MFQHGVSCRSTSAASASSSLAVSWLPSGAFGCEEGGAVLVSGCASDGAGIGGGAAAEGGGSTAGSGSGFGSGFGAGGAVAASGFASGFGRNGFGWVALVSGAIVTS